jgi:predicted transposase YdaD
MKRGSKRKRGREEERKRGRKENMAYILQARNMQRKRERQVRHCVQAYAWRKL